MFRRKKTTTDRITNRLSLAVGVLSWVSGVILILLSLPLTIPLGFLGWMTVLNSLGPPQPQS